MSLHEQQQTRVGTVLVTAHVDDAVVNVDARIPALVPDVARTEHPRLVDAGVHARRILRKTEVSLAQVDEPRVGDALISIIL